MDTVPGRLHIESPTPSLAAPPTSSQSISAVGVKIPQKPQAPSPAQNAKSRTVHHCLGPTFLGKSSFAQPQTLTPWARPIVRPTQDLSVPALEGGVTLGDEDPTVSTRAPFLQKTA